MLENPHHVYKRRRERTEKMHNIQNYARGVSLSLETQVCTYVR